MPDADKVFLLTCQIISNLHLTMWISIFLHELGHVVVMKATGRTIALFEVGLPGLVNFSLGGTSFSFGLLPLGGRVKAHSGYPKGQIINFGLIKAGGPFASLLTLLLSLTTLFIADYPVFFGCMVFTNLATIYFSTSPNLWSNDPLKDASNDGQMMWLVFCKWRAIRPYLIQRKKRRG